MISNELLILILSASSIAFFHTILGPDHYLPFIVLSKAKKWNLRKTLLVTGVCGLGHIAGSIILGIVGIFFGFGLIKLNLIESVREEFAAWLLISFGLIYFVWGIKKAIKNIPHKHTHFHTDGLSHIHTHKHFKEHTHMHAYKKDTATWILFLIFIFGPSGALMPLLIYPLMNKSAFHLMVIVGAFSITKLAVMILAVLISYLGLRLLPTKNLERFTHAMAGATIALSGIAIKFLGV